MVRSVLGWYRSFVTAVIPGISVVFLGRTRSEWDLMQNEISRKPCCPCVGKDGCASTDRP